MPFLFLVECKHRKYFYAGEYALRLDRQVLEHICEEAEGSKEADQKFAVPAVCFAFKRASKNRVWFIIPYVQLWGMLLEAGLPTPLLTEISPLHKKGKKQDYFVIKRSDVDALHLGGLFHFPIAEGIPDRGKLCIIPINEVEAILRHYAPHPSST